MPLHMPSASKRAPRSGAGQWSTFSPLVVRDSLMLAVFLQVLPTLLHPRYAIQSLIPSLTSST